jgi:hypothetical protein
MGQGAAGRGRDRGPEPTLHAVSRELAGARDMALDLQEATSGLIGRVTAGAAASESSSPDALFRLQNLDRLTQILDDLSSFLDQIARAAPDGWTIDAAAAARGLRLRTLAVRLTGREGEPPGPPAAFTDDFLL